MPFDMEVEEYEDELRERSMNQVNQGKSKKQIQYSNMVAGGSMVMMLVIIMLSWLWKIIN
tara:strand:- start:1588 stop:1767 length:180 start_codon:yes stop_codon:yes gene_type:complete